MKESLPATNAPELFGALDLAYACLFPDCVFEFGFRNPEFACSLGEIATRDVAFDDAFFQRSAQNRFYLFDVKPLLTIEAHRFSLSSKREPRTIHYPFIGPVERSIMVPASVLIRVVLKNRPALV